MTAANNMNNKRRNPWPLLGLLGVFLLPIMGTTLLSYFPDLIPRGRTNHGELLEPPPLIPDAGLQDAQGQPLQEPLRKHWHLLWLHRGQCGEHCAQLPDQLRRIQLALGKDANRLIPAVLLLTDSAPALGDLLSLRSASAQQPELLARLQAPPDKDVLYVIDPLGHAVLRYPVDTPPQGILKDIERLLKYSWVG